MARPFTPERLDVRRFAEEGATVSGETPLAGWDRLIEETQSRGGDRPVRWEATGELRNPRHHQPEIWMHLTAGTVLSLTCQRCLQPVDIPMTVDRMFRFVDDETVAAAIDDEAEEDVLATSRAFDVPQLVEDELLMGLPLAPHHETCPPVSVSVVDPAFDAQEGAKKENPFAQLGKLGLGKPGSGGKG